MVHQINVIFPMNPSAAKNLNERTISKLYDANECHAIHAFYSDYHSFAFVKLHLQNNLIRSDISQSILMYSNVFWRVIYDENSKWTHQSLIHRHTCRSSRDNILRMNFHSLNRCHHHYEQQQMAKNSPGNVNVNIARLHLYGWQICDWQ